MYKATLVTLGRDKIVAVKAFERSEREDFEKERDIQWFVTHAHNLTHSNTCLNEREIPPIIERIHLSIGKCVAFYFWLIYSFFPLTCVRAAPAHPT